MSRKRYTAVDLFSGCGGLTCGLKKAGFDVVACVEIDTHAAEAYEANHRGVEVYAEDIKEVTGARILADTERESIDLLAGCPPCQGFSSMRRRNKGRVSQDRRNRLMFEFLRLVEELHPKVILLENVPAFQGYYRFGEFVEGLEKCGYELDYGVLNASQYGVPQRRKRFVLLGSRIGTPKLPTAAKKTVTVGDAIEGLPAPEESDDALHKIHSHHTDRIAKMISLIPKDGGSRKDLPDEYILRCHRKDGIGFNDVYGRMSWDSVSPTITGGCLSPSKGRFLHPQENRSISVREALLLQSFPKNYKLPADLTKSEMALMVGNALPPKFAKAQADVLRKLLDKAS